MLTESPKKVYRPRSNPPRVNLHCRVDTRTMSHLKAVAARRKCGLGRLIDAMAVELPPK